MLYANGLLLCFYWKRKINKGNVKRCSWCARWCCTVNIIRATCMCNRPDARELYWKLCSDLARQLCDVRVFSLSIQFNVSRIAFAVWFGRKMNQSRILNSIRWQPTLDDFIFSFFFHINVNAVFNSDSDFVLIGSICGSVFHVCSVMLMLVVFYALAQQVRKFLLDRSPCAIHSDRAVWLWLMMPFPTQKISPLTDLDNETKPKKKNEIYEEISCATTKM